MFIFNKKKLSSCSNLYNKIALLSRNKYLYENLKIEDSFDSRVHLIFFLTSFILINLKNKGSLAKKKAQNIFDYTFIQIESSMRELGLGDQTVNKNMKNLTRVFYKILLICEKFDESDKTEKHLLIKSFFTFRTLATVKNIVLLTNYFVKFKDFASNLSLNNIEKGNIKFRYLGR